MEPSDNGHSGHAPIYSRKRKTATRGKKKESKRPGGVSTLINLFEPKQDNQNNGGASVSSSYAIGSHGETTDPFEGLAHRQALESSTKENTGNAEFPSGSWSEDVEGTAGSNKNMADEREADENNQGNPASEGVGGATSSDKSKADEREAGENDQDNSASKGVGGATGSDESKAGEREAGENDQKNKEKPMREYSAEARTYHAYFDELQRAHIRGHYTWCREHCLELLTEPRIPLWTRIQTLQLLSTMLQPAGAEQCLRDADHIIDDILDPREFQTQLLRDDNRKMKADRHIWRLKKNLIGKDIEGVDEAADEGPSDEYYSLDRDLDAKLRLETEEEMEPFNKPEKGDANRSEKEDVEMTDAGRAAGMPSPASSETG